MYIFIYTGAENLAKQDVLHHFMQRAPLLCEAAQVIYFLDCLFVFYLLTFCPARAAALRSRAGGRIIKIHGPGIFQYICITRRVIVLTFENSFACCWYPDMCQKSPTMKSPNICQNSPKMLLVCETAQVPSLFSEVPKSPNMCKKSSSMCQKSPDMKNCAGAEPVF
jgi:hypothetical protein